ncbi:PEPxxWA-CTERM sorting domain-containing protein [Gimibacter soli]|uniref:PEPxxWA-CTERM sorting domain-containing protein n=1 Tax=Gimibacter soli TaxID=3024400 RepID=A0AAE9XMW3_9PROT|nr:PEPxxWA-CTERM sorting domain-containing protein [Gimibacter soli]WCL53933.1 PEPxxWA-CTERM sorting domain-containing protein [Gimibacter soli]
MTSRIWTMLVFILALAWPATAATTIDFYGDAVDCFDMNEEDCGYYIDWGHSYEEAGYKFYTLAGHIDVHRNPSNLTAHVEPLDYPVFRMKVERTDGALFNFLSLNISFLGGGDVGFKRWTGSNGSVFEMTEAGTFDLPEGFERLSWLTLELAPAVSFGHGMNIDYMVLGTLPEPSTWLMMVLGFGLAAAAARRRMGAATA